MPRNLERLRNGERWWAAEVLLRGFGAILLSVCFWLGTVAQRMIALPPPHGTTLAEFAICAAIAFTLASGLALTLFGPGLLRQMPIPARSAFYWKGRWHG